MKKFKVTLLAATASCALLLQPKAADIHFYQSGSTGADGPFAPVIQNGLLTGVPPETRLKIDDATQIRLLDIPLNDSGVYNFTTIHIPGDMRVRFIPNARNTPVVWLATGDVTLVGEIDLSAPGTQAAAGGGVDMPGPGGFRGATTGRPGSGPDPGIVNVKNNGGNARLSIPLVAGSGTVGWGGQAPGGGAGGLLYLASSGKIEMLPSTGPARVGFLIQGAENLTQGGYGAVAFIANDIRGPLRGNLVGQFLVSAIRIGDVGPVGLLTFPTSLTGLGLPTAPPLARISTVGGVEIPPEVTPNHLFQIPQPGLNKIRIETRNLPEGITFRARLYRLDNQGRSLGGSFEKTITFLPTFGTEQLAQAEAEHDFAPGITFITAVATAPVNLAHAPVWNGEPLREMRIALDSDGKSSCQFLTESGAALSAEAAWRLARQQGKWGFLKQFAS